MIILGKRYLYEGKEVIVEDGDRLDQTWTVVVVATGKVIYGVCTGSLKDL